MKVIGHFISIELVFLCSLTITKAETLTGIVKQPEPPYLPAPASTVTVFEKGTNRQLAGPDTTDEKGRYRCDIELGKQVVVRANWRTSLSSPGTTEKKVEQNPTEADVQLLPAKTALPEKWMAVGHENAALTAETSPEVLQSLRKFGVPSESIYSYTFGAYKKAPQAHTELDEIKLFSTLTPEHVVEAIKAVEVQYKATSTVPNYQQLRLKKADLTQAQHIELLGFFLATSKAQRDCSRWSAALEKSLGPKDTQEVLERTSFISEKLLGPKVAEEWKVCGRLEKPPESL
jgi:hypothetical protein